MKKISWIILAVALYSCEPGNMTTIVHPDGSCERVFVAKATDAFIKGDTAGNPFPVTVDKNWKLEWKYNEDEKFNQWPSANWYRQPQDSAKVLKVYAKRTYASAEEMANNFRFNAKSNWSDLIPRPVVEKKFRWFYTYYSYSETFPQLPIKFPLPVENYMSKEEADYWLKGTTEFDKGISGMELYERLGKIKDKFETWTTANTWELQYASVLRNLDQLPGNPGYEQMVHAKDSIFKFFSKESKQDFKEKNIGEILNIYFNTKAFTPLMNEQNEISKKVNNPAEMEKFDAYTNTFFQYRLVMPGRLISANGKIEADTVSWNLDASKMLHSDYTLSATSKKMNSWTVILSLMVVVLALVLFFRKRP